MRRRDLLSVAGLLILTAVLAVSSLVSDSITYDETSHLTAGMSYLRTGDFRLTPETPPLAQMWAAAPLLLVDHEWPSPRTPGWREGDVWQLGRTWLFALNDGERLVLAPRCMMVAVLLATCLLVYLVGRSLFGSAAGLLALALAALSPTLLAHGRLVATDVAPTLCFLAVLWTFARVVQRITWGRLLGVSLTLAALCLVKYSWPLVMPALAVMAAAAILRSKPIDCTVLRWAVRRGEQQDRQTTSLGRRHHRLGAVALVVAVIGVIVWGSVWCCFLGRYGALRGDDAHAARMPVPAAAGQAAPRTMDAAWEVVLGDGDAETITRGAITTFVRWAREHRLLPEAYLYGLAFTQELSRTYSREVLPVYLMGECSQAGWRSYFPIAFAIKTPIVTMVLLAAGVVGLLTGRVTVRSDPLLLLGLVTFAVVYFAFLLTSSYNIGHRHLLPIYPVVIVLAGASVGWGSGWTGRWVIAGCLAWLLVGNLGIHPNYLCYFNELIGGPRNGYRYLAASNVDWGQNMKRLADYARSHPREKIKLAYHGSGDPRRYGFECDIIISSAPLGRLADLAPGTYVVSVNHLLGLYNAAARDSFWDDPEHGETYRRLHERFSRVSAQDASSARDPDRERAWRTYRLLRRGRLLNQLRWRATDERIGHALFVYRLPQADLDRLTGI